MSKFDVKQGDLTVEARYEAPAFPLLRQDNVIVEVLLSRLARYGATAESVFYGTTGSLGVRHVLVNTPNINGGVKIFLEKVEVGFNDLMRIDFAGIREVAQIVFESLEKVAAGIRFRNYAVSLTYHGLVDGVPADKFIGQYVGNVPDLGPVNGTAAGFYYGRKEPRDFLTVVADNSLVIPKGVFIRINGGFDGRGLHHAKLPEAGAAMVAEVLAGLKLEHDLDVGQKK